MNPRRYDLYKLNKLIESYINNENSSAKSELSKMVLEGEDLMDVLNNLNINMEAYGDLKQKHEDLKETYNKVDKNYRQLNENHEKLIKNLKSLINEKDGPFIIRINDILKEAKQD
jgi:hypothetical protein